MASAHTPTPSQSDTAREVTAAIAAYAPSSFSAQATLADQQPGSPANAAAALPP